MTEPTQTGGKPETTASETASSRGSVSPSKASLDGESQQTAGPTPAQAPWADESPSPWSRESVSAHEPAQFLAPSLPRDTEPTSTVLDPAMNHSTTDPLAPRALTSPAAAPTAPPPAPAAILPETQAPYQAQPRYQAQAPYQAQPAYQGYGVPYPTSAETSTQTSRRRLGLTALWLALSALVLGVILAVVSGKGYADIFLKSGYSPSASQEANQKILTEYLAQNPNSSLMLSTLGQFIPALLGIAALILGIISLKGASKAPGVWAIVVSVVAPIICVIVWMAVAVSGVLGR